MDDAGPDAKLDAPAARRNREPILEVLRRVLPPEGLVLEVASGTGQHVAWFAPSLPRLVWQPSEPAPELRASIAAWAAEAGATNVRPPLDLDVTAAEWDLGDAAADLVAIYCANLIHIAPWAVAEGLVAGAGRYLPRAGLLVLYGPFRRGGQTAPSNAAFDAGLRAQNPEWGVRELDEVTALCQAHDLRLSEVVEMPANNLSVVYRRN